MTSNEAGDVTMRAEIEALASQIRDSLHLLRRHL